MATQYVPLSPVDLRPEELQIQHPPETPELVYVDDPASYGMVDFAHDEPNTVNEDDTIDSVNMALHKTGAHDLLVLDSDGCLSGILHSADLKGAKPIQIMQSKRIERHEVKARMLMTTLEKVLCLNYDEILHARIGNLVASLSQQHRQYILAIDSNSNTGQQMVRGIISRWKLSDQLGNEV